MEKKSDSKLITLYQSRSEIAISETKSEYGRLIYSVAYGLLKNNMDAEECENDTYLGLWNSIPPAEPRNFEYSCAMKSHFRKSGNQMSGKWKSSYASLLA